MFPFPNFLGTELLVEFINSTHQLQVNGANTLTMPTGAANGDILVSIFTHSSLTPSMGGTAVTTWSSRLGATGTGYDMWVYWGVVTNAAGTVTLANGNGREAHVLAVFRGATSLAQKGSLQTNPGTGTTRSITGFTKSGACRGVLALVGEYNDGLTDYACSAPAGMSVIDSYKQTALAPSGVTGGTGVGIALAKPNDYPDGTTVTITNALNQATFTGNIALLEFT